MTDACAPLRRFPGQAHRRQLFASWCTAIYDANGTLLNVDRQALVGGTLRAELQKYFGISA
ncbi:MAG: hypothetical protein NVSMB12_00840 [Acidimicrobiales bacterium]